MYSLDVNASVREDESTWRYQELLHVEIRYADNLHYEADRLMAHSSLGDS